MLVAVFPALIVAGAPSVTPPLMAGLPEGKAIVQVGPPLSTNSPSPGSAERIVAPSLTGRLELLSMTASASSHCMFPPPSVSAARLSGVSSMDELKDALEAYRQTEIREAKDAPSCDNKLLTESQKEVLQSIGKGSPLAEAPG
jgi:hypothetical protein